MEHIDEEEARLRWALERAGQASEFHAAGPGMPHWAPGWKPRTDLEAFMGRSVHPLEEVAIRRTLAVLLERRGARP